MKKLDLGGFITHEKQRSLQHWFSLSLGLVVIALAIMVFVQIRGLRELKKVKTRYSALQARQDEREQQQKPTAMKVSYAQRLHECLMSVVTTIPEGIRLEAVTFENNQLILHGISSSTHLLLGFLELLKKESCFKEVILNEVKQYEKKKKYFEFLITSTLWEK